MVLAILFDSAGFGEWFLLLAVVLIVVGPKRLPETARTLGRYYSKFRRAAENFKRELLDMDKDVTSFVSDAEKSMDDAFAPEGDESNVVPGEGGADSEADGYDPDSGEYGDEPDPGTHGDESSSGENGDESPSGVEVDDPGLAPRVED